MSFFKVTENVYCLNFKSYLCCNYIIINDDDVYLIDGDMKSNAKNVEKALKKIDKDFSHVKAIMLTHWHNDHSAGVHEIQRKSNCKLYCHKNELKYFAKKTSKMKLFFWKLIPDFGVFVLIKGLIFQSIPFSIQNVHTIQDNENIDDLFLAIETPGHTEGHTSYYLKKQSILFAGDALAVVNSKLDLMAKVVTPDLETSNKSAKKLCSLDFKLVCPGHRHPLKVTPQKIHHFVEYIDNLS